MNAKFSMLSVMAFLLIALVATNVSAHTDPYEVTRIEVDDTPITDTTIVHVERGETMAVEVWVQGAEDLTHEIDDVRVEAEIFGYEFGTVEDVSEIFTIQPGVSYRKVLRLPVPIDIDPDEDYTLRIRVSDRENSIREEAVLRIKEVRHSLNIFDVIFNPGLDVRAGETLFSVVRIENLGEKKEEDIKVTMSIPELGLRNSVFIDELVTEVQERAHPSDDDEEDSASSDELFLRVPKNAEGEYSLVITVDYNRGHSVQEEVFSLFVLSDEDVDSTETETEAVISLDTSRQAVMQGEGAVYKFMVANLGNSASTYSLDVSNLDFGTSRVDPQTVTVGSDQTGELFLFVSADEDAPLGTQFFIVSVREGSSTVKTVSLELDVEEQEDVVDPWSNVRRGLEVGFFILLIILVVLGLIIAAKRLGGREESSEEGTEQSYY
jgi:uncharacterized membrane protein